MRSCSLTCLAQSLFIAAGIVTFTGTAVAEEQFGDLLSRATKLKDEGKYSQALAELSWAQKQLEQLHTKKLESFLPAQAGGFTGGEVEANSALGILNIERSYKDAAGTKLKASLTGSTSSEGGAAQGMGALAGFAQMAQFMGNGEAGSESVRIKNARGTITKEGSNLKLMLPLQSTGLFFSVEGVDGKATKEQLVSVAEAVDSAAIESYLKAQ
jgi:hypothetical protein